MAELHHFAYGWFNPFAAYLIAFLGSLLGLVCTARARALRTGGRRLRWLVLAAIACGGAGTWLMHIMAMLGFDVPATDVRYDPLLTAGSLLVAIGAVGVGLLIAGAGRRRVYRVATGGLVTGGGIASMHFTGVAALRLGGDVGFDRNLTIASIGVALTAGVLAMWFAVTLRRWWSMVAGAAVLAAALVGAHYTTMSALRVRLLPDQLVIEGLSPVLLVVPVTLLVAVALLGMAFSALQAMTEEEFGAAPVGRLGGAHAAVPWDLRPVGPASGSRPVGGPPTNGEVLVSTTPLD